MHVLLVYLFTSPHLSHSLCQNPCTCPDRSLKFYHQKGKDKKQHPYNRPRPLEYFIRKMTKSKKARKAKHQETPKESKKSSLPPFFTEAVPIALPPPALPFALVPANDVAPLSSPKESQKSLRSGSMTFLEEGAAPASPLGLCDDGLAVTAAGPSMNLENCSAAPFVPVWMFWAREEAVRRACV